MLNHARTIKNNRNKTLHETLIHEFHVAHQPQGIVSSMSPFGAASLLPTSWNSWFPFFGWFTSWASPVGSSWSSSLSLWSWIKFLSMAGPLTAGPLAPYPRFRAPLGPLGPLGSKGGICWRTRSPKLSKSRDEGISKPKAWTRLKSLFMPILIHQSRLTRVSHLNGDGMKSHLELETARLPLKLFSEMSTHVKTWYPSNF